MTAISPMGMLGTDDHLVSAPAESPATPLRAPTSSRPKARAAVFAIAVAAFLVEMAVSARYGYHRDELYFLAAGRHLAFGYVDQPPLTPLAARLSSALFGNALVGLRVLPALSLSFLVMLTAAMSRVLGAGRSGQVVAAAASATSGEFLATAHLMTTTAFDFAFSALAILLVLHLLRSADPRWWLAIGACVGVGSEAKWNIGFLVIGLAVGFLATDSRALLRSRYLAGGLALAVGLAAPDIIWQGLHGWPNSAVFSALQHAAGHNRVVYWPAQVLYSGLALTPIFVAGLIWSLKSASARRFRPVAIAAAFVLVLQFVLGGKPYYAGAAFTFLFAGGAVPVEAWIARRGAARARRSSSRRGRLLAMAMLGSFGLSLVVALPVLPAAALSRVPLQKINYDLAETIGWPKLVGLVAHEYDTLPASTRQQTAIVTGNYGEAGAIDRYGATYRLPQAYSGQNNFWLWGPPPAVDRTAVAVNIDPALLEAEFVHVRKVATFSNGLGVSDDEEGVAIYIVSGLRSSWAKSWQAFRHYD